MKIFLTIWLCGGAIGDIMLFRFRRTLNEDMGLSVLAAIVGAIFYGPLLIMFDRMLGSGTIKKNKQT